MEERRHGGGTMLVKDIRADNNSFPEFLTNDDGTLVFAAEDGISATGQQVGEPWTSDGTEAGTTLVADIRPGPVGSGASSFTVCGPYVYFTADDGFAGSELWAMYRPSTTAVSDPHPVSFALRGNHPNPFSHSTSIDFDLPRSARVAVRLYDLSGRLVRTLTDGKWPAGRHSVEWDGATDEGHMAAGGVYFYRMESEGFRNRRRLVFLR